MYSNETPSEQQKQSLNRTLYTDRSSLYSLSLSSVVSNSIQHNDDIKSCHTFTMIIFYIDFFKILVFRTKPVWIVEFCSLQNQVIPHTHTAYTYVSCSYCLCTYSVNVNYLAHEHCNLLYITYKHSTVYLVCTLCVLLYLHYKLVVMCEWFFNICNSP